MSPDFVRDGAKHAVAEMLRSGTTCFNDMYFHPDVIGEVCLETGIRATIGFPFLDFPNVYTNGADDCLTKARVKLLLPLLSIS